MSRLFIYGAGGHAKVIADIAEELKIFISAIFDNSLEKKMFLDKYPVRVDLNSLVIGPEDYFVIAIGNNCSRKRVWKAELQSRKFITLLHPAAVVSKYVDVQEGTVIMSGATVNAGARIGKHCIINTNSSVDHDCILEDFVHISPNVALAGNVKVGEGTHVGIGAAVIQGVCIGKNCTIGAGSIVIRDIPDGVTVVGNPARIISEK